MSDNIVSFDTAKEKHRHQRKDQRVSDMRQRFQQAREADMEPAEKRRQERLRKKRAKKRGKR